MLGCRRSRAGDRMHALRVLQTHHILRIHSISAEQEVIILQRRTAVSSMAIEAECVQICHVFAVVIAVLVSRRHNDDAVAKSSEKFRPPLEPFLASISIHRKGQLRRRLTMEPRLRCLALPSPRPWRWRCRER